MKFAKDYRSEAWSKLNNGNWGTMVLAAFILLIFNGLCSSFTITFREGQLSFSTGIGGIASLLLSGPLAVGMAALSINVIRQRPVEIKMLFVGFYDYGKSLVLYLLITIFTALWTLLFIIPGMIKAISYSMSYYIMLDRPELSASQAIKESMRIMEGNKWRYFCLMLSFIGWYILCVLTLGLLTLLVQPYVVSAKAAFYESIRDRSHDPVESQAPKGGNGGAAEEPFGDAFGNTGAQGERECANPDSGSAQSAASRVEEERAQAAREEKKDDFGLPSVPDLPEVPDVPRLDEDKK